MGNMKKALFIALVISLFAFAGCEKEKIVEKEVIVEKIVEVNTNPMPEELAEFLDSERQWYKIFMNEFTNLQNGYPDFDYAILSYGDNSTYSCESYPSGKYPNKCITIQWYKDYQLILFMPYNFDSSSFYNQLEKKANPNFYDKSQYIYEIVTRKKQ